MKKTFGFILFGLIIPMIAGCKYSNSSETGTTSVVVPPVSLKECIENTEDFFISFGTENSTILEINTKDTYYYGPHSYGYTVLDDDKDYMHFFSIERGQTSSVMEMNGRVGSKKDFNALRTSAYSFMSLLDVTSEFYEKKDDWTYYYYGYELARPYKEYFQLNAFNFCDFYLIKIGQDGRIVSFQAGELGGAPYNEDILFAVNTNFYNPSITTVGFFNDWKQNGSVINERIFDYKSFYYDESYKTCYTSGSIEAIVNSIEYDGSFYISHVDKHDGPIGMHVTTKESNSVEIGDKVKVSGDIVMDNRGKYFMSPRFINASVEVLEKNVSVPFFSEESIIDSYVPGIYAATNFISSPLYSSSLYSGYGYIGDIPNSVLPNKDVTLSVYYPDFKFEDGSLFKCNLIFPKEYGQESIENALIKIRELGDYSISPATSKLAFLQNVIVSFIPTGNTLNFYVTNSSLISHRLSFEETIELDYGVAHFPLPTGTGESSGFFHFGDSSSWYLEDQYYGYIDSDGHLSGVFYFDNVTNRASIDAYISKLIDFGASLVDIIAFSYSNNNIHHIYELPNHLYVDLMFDDNFGKSNRLQLFIYEADAPTRTKTIGQKIEEELGFFKDEDFIRLPGTYDYNYRFYRLPSFAGNDFGKEHPLTIATLDLNENRFEELRKAYRDAGWKQYRNSDNTAYSYMTRGTSRIVYYKENENGKKTFIDFGMYSTTDYTFLNHKKFQYRIEMAIYEGDEPFKTIFTQDLDCISRDSVTISDIGIFDWKLPSKYKAEVYRKSDLFDVEFGYGYVTNAFIYPEIRDEEHVNELLEYVKSTIEEHGYTLIFQTDRGYNYGYYYGENNVSIYLYFMKDVERGFVRVISSLGGADF